MQHEPDEWAHEPVRKPRERTINAHDGTGLSYTDFEDTVDSAGTPLVEIDRHEYPQRSYSEAIFPCSVVLPLITAYLKHKASEAMINSQQNPEAIRKGQEAMQALLARSATDLAFREKLVSDPRGAITEHTGREVPKGFDMRFVENEADATIVLPDYRDPEAELDEEQLETVAGGHPLLVLAGLILYDQYEESQGREGVPYI